MNNALPLSLNVNALEKPARRPAFLPAALARLAKIFSVLFRAADDLAARRYAARKYAGAID